MAFKLVEGIIKANATHQIPHWKFLHDFTFMLNLHHITQHILDNEKFHVYWKKLVPSRRF